MRGWPVLLLSLSQTLSPGTYLPLWQSSADTRISWVARLGSDPYRIPSRVPVTAPCPMSHRPYKNLGRPGRGACVQAQPAAVQKYRNTWKRGLCVSPASCCAILASNVSVPAPLPSLNPWIVSCNITLLFRLQITTTENTFHNTYNIPADTHHYPWNFERFHHPSPIGWYG